MNNTANSSTQRKFHYSYLLYFIFRYFYLVFFFFFTIFFTRPPPTHKEIRTIFSFCEPIKTLNKRNTLAEERRGARRRGRQEWNTYHYHQHHPPKILLDKVLQILFNKKNRLINSIFQFTERAKTEKS